MESHCLEKVVAFLWNSASKEMYDFCHFKISMPYIFLTLCKYFL